MKLQKTPKGYLSLLDATTLGRAPEEASDVVIPIIDIEKYYVNRVKLSWTDFNQSGPGTDTSMTVPEGERWLVHKFSAYTDNFNPAIGTTCQFAMALIQQAAGQESIHILGQPSPVPDIQSTNALVAAVAEVPFILDAGDQIGDLRYSCSALRDFQFGLEYTILNI